MQKQKHPSGQNQGYRYNGNNGTEGGGAGGGYPGAAMRLCPQGPGQPGTQQQDPKQPTPQQGITGGMQVSYSQTARGQNQYFPRHQRLNTPRMPAVGNMPMPNISYVQGNQSVYAAGPVPIMMQHIPYQIQPSGARHQAHAPAPAAAAGPPSGSFYPAQPQPGGTIYIQQPVQTTPTYYSQAQLFGIPAMRGHSYPANSATNQMPTQQAPPQQPQVVSGAGAANQGMMPLGIPTGGGPPPQVLAGAQQSGQLTGQPGQLVGGGQPGGGGGPSLVLGVPSHKDKRKRPNAIPIVNPQTGADVIEQMLIDEEAGGGLSGGTAGQGRDADHHLPSQVAAEFAALVAARATENLVAPAVTETPPPPPVPSPAPSSTVIPTEDAITTTPVIIMPNGPQAPPSGTPTPPPATPTSLPVVEQHPAPPTQQTVIAAPSQPPTPALIPIVSAQTNSPAVDLHRPTQHVSVPPASSPARKPIQQQQQSAQHVQQVVQEPAEVKTVKPKKEGRRLTPIPTSSPSLSNQQHPVVTSTIGSGSVGVQLPTVVESPAVQQQHSQQPVTTATVQQQTLKEHQPVVTSVAAKREQTPSAQQSAAVLPPPPPHKTSFADSFDVKNFVSSQQPQQQKSVVSVPSNVSSSAPVEPKETNGETDVHDSAPPATTATSTAHQHPPQTSSHGPSSVGSKPQQRQKSSKHTKKKDLNRKGDEKEGTDMDAFVGTQAPPPVVSASSAPNVAAATVSTTTIATATTTVIQKTIAPAASTTAAPIIPSTTTTVPSSVSQTQQTQQRQPSPSMEKRLPIIESSAKQLQDERDRDITESMPPSTTSIGVTSVATTTNTTSPLTSTETTPTATPMSDDSDTSRIEAMVAAKNQENTKVSALMNNNNINNNNINNNINNNNNNNSSNALASTTENNNAKSIEEDTPVTTESGGDSPQTGAGTVIETMTIERSQPPQLLYNYKEGQWSPVNTDGKKVYDRDFLLEVRKNPMSTRKPNNPIDPDVIREKSYDTTLSNNNNRRNVHASNSMSLGNRGDNAVPGFMRSSHSHRGVAMMSSKGGRGSGGGGGGPRMGGGGGSMSGSLRDRDRMMGKGGGSFGGPMIPFRGEEPQLHKTANSWKPTRNEDNKDKSDDDLKTEKLLKAVRGILNKLTPQKFETLSNQILSLPIDNNDRLTKVVHLVFSKAVDEPSFSKEYAELCKRLSLNKVALQQQPQQQPQEQQGDQQQQQQQQQHSASFRKLLLTKCQEEFERNKTDELNIEARTKEIEDCTDQEKKKELKLQLEEEERIIRIKKVGLVRFIGELYKLKMLTNKIMHGCITVLLDKIDEESLECLCKLLTTIGKELEQLSDKKDFDMYFQKMFKLSQKTPDPIVSSRIRFMLQDVIELRSKNWVPRRDENNPKTIEQIEKDAARETMLESALLSSQGGSGGGRSGGGGGGRHDSRDDRRGRQRGGGQSEDGWHSVVGSGKNFTKNSYSVEPSKLLQFKEMDSSMSLGSSNQWGHWILGAGTKKSSNPQVHVNNKFAALGRSDQDERKIGMSSMMNRKGVITPSPSLEKDRAFAGLKEVMLDSGRNTANSGSSIGGGRTGSGGSGPPSRDSSRLRYGGSSLSGTETTNIASSSSTSGLSATTSLTSNKALAVQPAAVVPQNVPPMPEEEAERKTKTVIEEWLDNNNIQETVQTVQDTFVGVANLLLFLRSALNLVMEHRKVIARPRTGHLLAMLVQENIFPHQELMKEFAFFVEMGEDNKVDIPLIWTYIGELLGPVIAQEVFTFADLRTISDQVRPSEGIASALAEIIRTLIKDKGPGWIRTTWESSRVQMKDFVLEDDVDKFLKDNNLGFIMGDGEVQVQADASLTPSMVEEKILSFLQKDNDKALDHVGEWINANVGQKTKENDFIKALTRAVIKASLKGDKILSSKFAKNEKLIKKFVDNDEGRELACLYSIQNLLVNELVQAPGVLLETFQTLYENGTISRDAFLRWKDPRHDENICDVEHAGRGVALASLQSFFVSLSEQDDTDDETPS